MIGRAVMLEPAGDGRGVPDWNDGRRTVLVAREDERAWYGKPVDNPACPELEWPKYAWREVRP